MAYVSISFDLRLVAGVLERARNIRSTPGLRRHLEAIVRDGAAFEMQRAPAESGCTYRIVPSIQLLRLLEQHEARV